VVIYTSSKEEIKNNSDDIQNQYTKDKDNIEKFLEHKSPTFNFSSLKRLMLSELSYKGAFKYNRICGFSRRQIINMIQHSERYGANIVRLSQYMMQKSGYYKRLVDYFVNMAVINWTIDTEIKQDKLFSINQNTFKKNYIKYTSQVNKFKIDNRIADIMRKVYVEDACFGFVVETDVDTAIYFIDSRYCEIKSIVNGDVLQYGINRSLLSDAYIDTLPNELQILLEQSKKISKNNMVLVPYENSFCIKYHNDFTYLYSPFYPLISAILDIDDMKDLAKAKSEADAYKIIYFKIPVNDEGQISLGDELITPFIEAAETIVPERFGIIPSPMDLQLVESKSTVSDDKNKVEQSVDNYYGEAGVSKALISSASSGSELKLSMKVDSSDVYRIYKQVEAWMDLQMKIRGHIYDAYQFVYRILPTTIFDIDDYIDRQLKLSQSSIPNKGMLLAANGINTAKMLGNSFTENIVFKDIFDMWQPLKSSYTQSGDANGNGGRPEKDETEIENSTDTQRQNDSNSTENRI